MSPDMEPLCGFFQIPDLFLPFLCHCLLGSFPNVHLRITRISDSASGKPKLRQRAGVMAIQLPGREGVKEKES